MWVYISGPSGPKSKGIYVSHFDQATGKITEPVLAADVKRASYFWIHPNGKFVYSVDQGDEGGKPTGYIRAFAIEPGTGKLTELNHESTIGSGTCYVSLDREGKFALAANYGSGSVTVLPVGPDGKLGKATAFVQLEGSGPNPKRQTHSYGHCFDFDPSEKFALACDLGADRVNVFRFDRDAGKLTLAGQGKVAPGSGPRHITFSHDGKFAYVINEMGMTLTVFSYNGDTGAMTEVQTISTLPSDYQQSDKDTAAEVFFHPNGKWLYASNRGHDSVVRFLVDESTGKLSDPKWTPSGGRIPRYFGIDPSGKWMLIANEGSGTVLVHKIESDGSLTPTGDKVEVGSAMCIKYLPAE